METCPLGCGLSGLHSTLDCATRRGAPYEGDAGGACARLRADLAALRVEVGAAWARGLEEGLARGNARAERAEARVGALWRALRLCVAEWDEAPEERLSDATVFAARAALGEEKS